MSRRKEQKRRHAANKERTNQLSNFTVEGTRRGGFRVDKPTMASSQFSDALRYVSINSWKITYDDGTEVETKTMLGRLVISSHPNPPGCENIMAIPGLHLSFAKEETARKILMEYAVDEKRIVTLDLETAKRIFARSGYTGEEPQLVTEPKLLDLWEVGKTYDATSKPRFRQVANGIIAAAMGMPFWKDSGLWTTAICKRYIEGELSFESIAGYGILQGEIEKQVLLRNVEQLNELDINW